jgi:hypothetical protein
VVGVRRGWKLMYLFDFVFPLSCVGRPAKGGK